MCIKDNQELHKKLDAFDPNKIMEVITQAVAGGYQKSFQKPNSYQKSTNPYFHHNKSHRQVKMQACLANHISGRLENLKLLLVQMIVLTQHSVVNTVKTQVTAYPTAPKLKGKRLSKLLLPLNSQTSPKRETRQARMKGS